MLQSVCLSVPTRALQRFTHGYYKTLIGTPSPMLEDKPAEIGNHRLPIISA